MSKIKKLLQAKHSKLSVKKRYIEENHPADLDNYYENGKFYIINIELITPDPNQPRKYFNPDSLNELSQSIKQQGVLQPVIIRKQDNDFFLVAGERRFRASKMAGLSQIPAILSTGKPDEIALIENIQRENLNPIEESMALNQLMQNHNYTQEKLAEVVGKKQSTISETLSLNKLPDEIKRDYRRADNFSKRVLIEITKQKTPKAMIALFDKIEKDKLTGDQVRNITRKKKESSKKNQADIISTKTNSLLNSLKKFHFHSINEQEKSRLRDEFILLKNTIDESFF